MSSNSRMPESIRRKRQVASLKPRSSLFKQTPSVPKYPSSSLVNAATERKFDPESGLVFSETEFRPGRSKHADWIREFSSPHVVTKPVPNSRGARSLSDIARTKVVHEFRNLSSDHFETVPWPVAEKIWTKVVETRSESFHAFRTFAAAYPDAEEFGQPQYRHLVRIKQPSLPFPSYYGGITSPDTKWLTCLRVSPMRMTTPDLVSLHTVTNLAVLDLSDTGTEHGSITSNFDERIMRSWAQLAASGQAFQQLRVLMFGWQEHLSDWVFNYTQCFPSLCHVIVTECPNMHQTNRAEWEKTSQAAGWEARHAKRSVKSLRPIIGNTDFYPGSVSGCFYDSQDLFAQLAHSRRPPVTWRLPLLEVWIGSPKQWLHIVEDFPKSTQTIFFENIKTQSEEAKGRTRTSTKQEQTKRIRDQGQAAPGTASPPSKRGSQSRPAMRSTGRNLADMLQEFRA